MKKLIVIASTLIALAGIAAGGIAALQPAPAATEPIWSTCYSGTSSGCDQLYTDNLSTTIRYRFLNGEQTPTVDRPATTDEIAIYDSYKKRIDIATATDNLEANIAGVKWVRKLRQWKVDALAYESQWGSLTANQKDAVTQEMLKRQALTWGALADLLVILDKGQ